MTRSRNERKRRKQLLKQKNRCANPKPPVQVTHASADYVSFDSDDDWDLEEDDDGDLEDEEESGFHPFPKEAIEQFTDYGEAIYCSAGAILKALPSRVIIRASNELRHSEELKALVAETLRSWGREEREADWGYWDESLAQQERALPEPWTELCENALMIHHRRADDQWTYHLPGSVTVRFRGEETFVRGPHQIIDLDGFRFMICDAVLIRRDLVAHFYQVRETQGDDEAMKVFGPVTFERLDGKRVQGWNVLSGE